jgi:adenine/guanine phosphoribosyltransferase-like PRPP-binding protein
MNREQMVEMIDHRAIYRCGPTSDFPYLPGKAPNKWYQWQFYTRRLLYNPQFLTSAVDLLLPHLNLENVQFGACEDAGVALAVALSMRTGVSMFSIKKTRKAYGLLNFTEGPILDKPVLLVDDVAGSQTTLRNAEALLKQFGLPCGPQYCTLINKNVEGHDTYLDKQLVSLFNADEFALTWSQYEQRYGHPPLFGKWH